MSSRAGTVRRLQREWKVFPGAFGFGGQTTQQVLYELLQLYIEQGCRGTQIQFGTPRALLLRIWPEHRHPSSKDYVRLRRDLDILRGYDFQCRNAFWDRKRHAYVDMHWRLFGDVCYFKPRSEASRRRNFPWLHRGEPRSSADRSHARFLLARVQLGPLPHTASARTAPRPLPLKEVRLAGAHQRRVMDLARALPIEASDPKDVRKAIARAARGLLDRRVPTLKSVRFEKSPRTGEWLAVFERDVRPKQDYRVPRRGALSLDPEIGLLVNDIVRQVGSRDECSGGRSAPKSSAQTW